MKKRIKDPEAVLLAGRCLARTLNLYASGSLVPAIEVWMLTVPARRLLRSIYGSDIRAALSLLRYAFGCFFSQICWSLVAAWRYKVRLETPEDDLWLPEEMPVEDFE